MTRLFAEKHQLEFPERIGELIGSRHLEKDKRKFPLFRWPTNSASNFRDRVNK
jgi:hypothetical protein